MLVVMLPAMFSGCFGEDEIVTPEEEVVAYLQPWERADEIYDDSDVFSRVTVMELMESIQCAVFLLMFQQSLQQMVEQD